MFLLFAGILYIFTVISCNDSVEDPEPENLYTAISNTFGDNIDFANLYNYANQTIPNYITKDNTTTNPITDKKATLGRVLFYDKQLSVNNTIACANCHQQAAAFSDLAQVSTGVNGSTGRHSMRLINARFATETRFFWDERAATLEAQTTQPIQDHTEMGFSGQDGDPTLNDLLDKLEAIDYYQELFQEVYGDQNISEARLQECLAQFIRSIQSFDSKYDIGRAQVANNNINFPNFSNDENQGKTLFLTPPQFNPNGVRVGGGAGCGGCHRAPEFDIDANSLNNGIIGIIAGGTDLTVTRAPTLRDVFRNNGNELNGGLMHTGAFSMAGVIDHYDQIRNDPNNNLDPRLRPGGNPQDLALTQAEKDQLLAFLKTLTGTDVYTNPKWSNPFPQ